MLMVDPIAYDTNGVKIEQNDVVRIVKEPSVNHNWLRVGREFRAAYWEDRSLGGKYICVFLRTKNGSRLCSLGVKDSCLEIVERQD